MVDLVARISVINEHMLPKANPTNSYTDKETLQMYAYRLLVRAEVEGYIEELAQDFLDVVVAKNDSMTLSQSARVRILRHVDYSKSYPPRSLTAAALLPRSDASKVVKHRMNSLGEAIAGNNGLSEKDVLKLFVPLGVEVSLFDHAWLKALNALASARGEVAHNSIFTTTRTQPTPESERGQVAAVLWGLRSFTIKVDGLISEC